MGDSLKIKKKILNIIYRLIIDSGTHVAILNYFYVLCKWVNIFMIEVTRLLNVRKRADTNRKSGKERTCVKLE